MIATTRTHESRAELSISRAVRRTKLLSALAGLLVMPLSALGMDLEQKVDFHIPAQELSTALIEFSKQARLQVIVADDLTGQTTQGVSGQKAIKQALGQLLEPAGLGYRVAGKTSITVGRRKEAGKMGEVGSQATRAGYENSLIRIAQNDGQSSNDSQSASQPQTTPSPDRGEDKGQGLEEIVVTGTHIRGVDHTLPLRVLDNAYIKSTGLTTAGSLIESLPQNFAFDSQASSSLLGTFGLGGSNEQGESINLRGIGTGTTLTLINGRRIPLGLNGAAADISALPLSAIDRVEILLDGASALYGSDAVGGVVNFILKRDFEGAETALRAGTAKGGVNEYRASQAFGHAWTSGNALISLEYYKRDLLLAKDRDFVPSDSLGSLMPEDKNYSAAFSGRQTISQQVSIFADALYTKRRTFNQGGPLQFNVANSADNPQLMSTAGLNWALGAGWQLETSGTYARNKQDQENISTGSNQRQHLTFDVRSVQLKADGSLFQLPAGAAKAALGADWRSERYRRRSIDPTSGLDAFSPLDEDQIVRSAFAELRLPIIDEPNARSGAKRIEISLAGRIDDYSSFGSSFDPQFGLLWEPVHGLRVRANHGSSYKAPNLVDYDLGANFVTAFTTPDPGASSGISRVLGIFGGDPASFRAQNSKSSSFGVELVPRSIKGLKVSLDYYRIDYTDRISQPSNDVGVMLANERLFPGLIIREPTLAQVQAAIATGNAGFGFFDCDVGCIPDPNFDPASVQVIVDERRRNLAAVGTRGLDLSANYHFAMTVGDVSLGINTTHIFEREDQITSASPTIEKVDTIFNPPDWRARGTVGWQYQGWAANIFVNYTDSFSDNRTLVPARVSSYTTADTHVAYEISNTTISLNVQNLFDRNPPPIAVLNPGFEVGFDPTNANPLGRLVSLEVSKVW